MDPQTSTTTYVLKDRQRDVTFDGDLIATASSQDAGKERWSEMSIYTTDDGRYVVHGIGKSSIDGETDREWTCACSTPQAVIQALTRTTNGVSYMPNLNVLLLQRASMIDDGLQEAACTQAI